MSNSAPVVESVTSYLLEVLAFAAEAHSGQRRKNATGAPYIEHPIGVARILSSEARVWDTEVIAAALLHDTLPR